MVGKFVLPLLGSAPEVWPTTVLFFQAVLLAGYAFAHVTSWLPPRRQALLQLVLLGVAGRRAADRRPGPEPTGERQPPALAAPGGTAIRPKRAPPIRVPEMPALHGMQLYCVGGLTSPRGSSQ
jgi:hypothetical protein